MPILLRIPGLFDRLFQGQKTLMVEMEELLAEHRRTWDPTQPPRDLTDAYLIEVEKVGHCQEQRMEAGGPWRPSTSSWVLCTAQQSLLWASPEPTVSP